MEFFLPGVHTNHFCQLRINMELVILICEITKSTEHPKDSTKLSLIYVIGMWGTKGGSIFCNYFTRCESDRLMVLGLITGARATIEETSDVFKLYFLLLFLRIFYYVFTLLTSNETLDIILKSIIHYEIPKGQVEYMHYDPKSVQA